MISKGKLSGKIPVTANLMAELVVMSLSHAGWNCGTYNLLNEVTASKRKNNRAGTLSFETDLAATVSWEPLDERTTRIVVETIERNGNMHARECQKECASIIDGVFRRAPALQSAMKNAPARTTYGNARWATKNDLAAADYIKKDMTSSRMFIGAEGEHNLALTADDTQRHTLVCGPTGCGKTSTIFIPNLLLRTEWSAIVTEATAGSIDRGYQAEERPSEGPDLFLKTSGYRQKAGHKIYYFNPDDMHSHRINPIDGVKSIRQATRLANLIRANTNLRDNPTDQQFWEQAETNLLCSLIMHAAGVKGNMQTVRLMLREGPDDLTKTLTNSPIDEARGRFREFMTWGTDNTRTSIVIGLIQRLELWTQPRIVALTETTDIDFETLKDELFTFYLSVPENQPELKPCVAIIFSYLLDYVCSQRFKHPLSLFLDEFTNFGYIPKFPNRLSILRHRQLPTILGLQDFVQAEQVYHDAASLFFTQPGTRIFFRPQAHAQAKIISESLGIETVYQRQVTGNCHLSEREFSRELMTTGAVLALPKGKAIAFTTETAPILVERVRPEKFNDQTRVPAPTFRELAVDDSLHASSHVPGRQPVKGANPTQSALEKERIDERSVAAGKSKQRVTRDAEDRLPPV